MSSMSLPLSRAATKRNGRVLWIIARKEITDAFGNRLFLMATLLLLALTLTAIALGAVTVRNQVMEYEQSVQILQNLGRTDIPPMPSLNPIAVSKNFINYLTMVGALLAMILGFTSIQKERQGGTLPLIFSRPVYRDQFITGKVLGHALLMGALMLIVCVTTVGALTAIGGVGLTADHLIKLALTMLMSWLYLLIFFLLAMFFTLWRPDDNQGLVLTIIIWLLFAFILPQIGDTMDLDNQLPGGFFASLGMDKAQQEAALQQFKWYETVRDGLEQLSPTKHYERISFALLGIKTQFSDNSWLEILKLKLIDLVGLIVPNILLLLASYVVFLRQEK